MTANDPDSPGPTGTWDDGKAPDALRTIGEVAQALGIRQHVLRYWEDQFPMLRPLKRSGGRRYYRPEDVVLIGRIDQLVHRSGYTLRGARTVIEGEVRAGAFAAPSEPPPSRDAAAAAAALQADGAGDPLVDQALRDRLVAMRDRLALALAAQPA
ncbi:MAG: MerR family transcriptional regulator [Sphingomonadales bacterium]|nr:MerR family transcriptional regulator [Sphingomonadales bacterium]